MQIKVETFVFITLTEQETKVLIEVAIPDEFDCKFIEKIMKTNPSEEVKSVAKQIYVAMMTNDAWYCRLAKAVLSQDVQEVIPEVKTTPIDPNAKQRILFLNTAFDSTNPIAVLVEIPAMVSYQTLLTLEREQISKTRTTCKWIDLMKDGNIPHKEISRGRKSNYTPSDYDVLHYLNRGK